MPQIIGDRSLVEVDNNVLLDIFTDVPDHVGQYTVTVVVSATNSLGDDLSNEIDFELFVVDIPCAADTLTLISAPDATSTYYINFLNPTIGSGSVDY